MRTSMLILIAHGSRDPRWRASVEELSETLQADLGHDSIRLAYMDCAPPTLADVAAEAMRKGVNRLRVLPLFMTAQGHVERNIQPLVDDLRQRHKSIEVELLPPVGQHPLFIKLLSEIASQTSE